MANAAISAAMIAAAQQEAGTKAILAQLEQERATNARRAIKIDLSTKGSDAIMAKLVKYGHVKDVGGGRYWLDTDAVERSKANAGRVAMILLAFVVSVGASILALTKLWAIRP